VAGCRIARRDRWPYAAESAAIWLEQFQFAGAPQESAVIARAMPIN